MVQVKRSWALFVLTLMALVVTTASCARVHRDSYRDTDQGVVINNYVETYQTTVPGTHNYYPYGYNSNRESLTRHSNCCRQDHRSSSNTHERRSNSRGR
jgi:hypothetical protein